jgi:hypothetical protein
METQTMIDYILKILEHIYIATLMALVLAVPVVGTILYLSLLVS